MRRLTTRLAAGAALAGAAALAMTGCASAAPSATSGDGLRIVTTTTQVTDFVTKLIEGTGATVTPLLAPGQSAHSFEAQPAELVAIAEAGLVVASGGGLENWLDAALEAAGYTGPTVEAADGFDPAVLAESVGHELATGGTGAGDATSTTEPGASDTGASNTAPSDEHDHSDHDHSDDASDDAAATATASETDHDGHDHAEGDPHIWSAPMGAAYMVGTIAEQLAETDPTHADAYRANADAYLAKLTALDEWIGANIGAVPEGERLIVTNHHALTAFAEAYHVTVVGSIMPSWDDNAEPSAQELDALIQAIRDSGARAVFSETQLSAATAEMIANEAGVAVYSGADALMTDALGAAGTPEASYVGATVHNASMLLDSWGATPTALPAALQGA